MERLTKRERNSDGTAISKKSMIDREGYPTVSDYASKVLTKLADYEDAEEQGLLLRLPCKVGDKIFLVFAGFGKDIDKFTVKGFHLDCFEDGETILFCDYESNDRTLSGQFDVMNFGKKVFFTESEAEAKLKEMEGAE